MRYNNYYKPVSKSRPHRKQEENLQLKICQYIRSNYPDVVFRSDFASGLYLSPFQATKHAKLQSSRSFPDLMIFEPRNNFHGCALELKRQDNSPYLKNGKLSSNEHVQEQAYMLERLRNKGYYAEFGVGYEDILKKVHQYLGVPLRPKLFEF